jgi:hypothetical protein
MVSTTPGRVGGLLATGATYWRDERRPWSLNLSTRAILLTLSCFKMYRLNLYRFNSIDCTSFLKGQ